MIRTITGPVIDEVLPDELGKVPFPDCRIGAVAGARGDGRGFNPLIQGDDDGLISLASATLDDAEDNLWVRCNHSRLPRHREVIRGTVRYLATGRF